MPGPCAHNGRSTAVYELQTVVLPMHACAEALAGMSPDNTASSALETGICPGVPGGSPDAQCNPDRSLKVHACAQAPVSRRRMSLGMVPPAEDGEERDPETLVEDDAELVR